MPTKRIMQMPRAKVAIIHPELRFGGAEAVTAWAIEALMRDFDVTFISTGAMNPNELNTFYGTSLDPAEFSVRIVPVGLHRLTKFAALRRAILQRYIWRIASGFDVVISALNAYNFGIPGIQLIAGLSFTEEWQNILHPSLKAHTSWRYSDSALRCAYFGLCNFIAPLNTEAWKRNLTVANSAWSAAGLRREFGVESRLVYPPVAAEFPRVSWERKENGFVCIGRVVGEKRMDAVIRIVEKVRQAGHDVHLHILGGLDDDDPPLGVRLRELAIPRKWVSLEGRTLGQRKLGLIAGHRFGINACINEAFGIAPAELVKAGAITFVHASGGQTEIVNHQALTFRNDEDAVNKICTVLSSATLQENLRRHLLGQATKFSVESFMSGFRQVVGEFLAARLAAKEVD